MDLDYDETYYFSCLDEIQQDSIDSIEENYYTPLRLDNMTSRDYTSL